MFIRSSQISRRLLSSRNIQSSIRLYSNKFPSTSLVRLRRFSSTFVPNKENEDPYVSTSSCHGHSDDFLPLFNHPDDPHAIRKFRLSKRFVEQYQSIKPPFGFNGLGELVYKRTYSRDKEDGTKEEWYETVERVVNGCYNMQKNWLQHRGLGWNSTEAQKSAKKMYDRIFYMKFLPPGRGLWAMGSPLTEERGLYAALNNCAFVSTQDMDKCFSPAEPFCFLMDAAMLGVGVGFDTKGAGKISVREPKIAKKDFVYVIPDSREGWVESIRLLLESYFLQKSAVSFDYSKIRPAGEPIRGFGGISSGPEPLRILHQRLHETLTPLIGQSITIRAIVDIMNHIGVCVVAGNVRRTAEIAFGDYENEDYISLKDYEKHPERMEYGWTSNNSVFAQIGMNYEAICQKIQQNGEPGFAWLQNMQEYGRMNGKKDLRDHRAQGGNPCLEQTLESYELCCLVETFPTNHETLEDYQETLRYAYLYAKTVTLGQTHWPITNRVMLRNRRIGCSMSGIAQFISHRGLDTLRQWCESGYDSIQEYDRQYSDFLAIPRSIKTTSIKPSGTVSLLAGATPGMHYPESRFYIRRVRLDMRSPLLPVLKDAGYHLEPDVYSSDDTMIVSIPVDVGENVRTVNDLSMWEQLSLASFLQKHWADNQVSCTVSFDPQNEGNQLSHALSYFQYQLKGISFLPRLPLGAYPQMPYEAITQEQYKEMKKPLKSFDFSKIESENGIVKEVPDRFCDSNSCEFVPPNQEQFNNDKS